MTEADLFEGYLEKIRSLASSLSNRADSLTEESKLGTAGAAPDPDVELLIETLRLWAEFLTNTQVQRGYANNALEPGDPTWVDRRLSSHLNAQLKLLTLPFDRKQAMAVGDDLRGLLRSIVQRSDLLEPVGMGHDGIDFLNFKYSVLLRLQELEGKALQRAVTRARQAAAESEKDAEATARAAGKTGDDAMSSFYAKMAKSESKSADNFRSLTVAFAMGAGAVAGIFVFLPHWILPGFDVAPYVALAQKSVFVAGIFGLAGYFARQAHQHRAMANWAGSLAVQLQTFDAYVAAVASDEVRDDLRKSFAARAFGDHPAMKGEPTVSANEAAIEKIVEVATRIVGK